MREVRRMVCLGFGMEVANDCQPLKWPHQAVRHLQKADPTLCPSRPNHAPVACIRIPARALASDFQAHLPVLAWKSHQSVFLSKIEPAPPSVPAPVTRYRIEGALGGTRPLFAGSGGIGASALPRPIHQSPTCGADDSWRVFFVFAICNTLYRLPSP